MHFHVLCYSIQFNNLSNHYLKFPNISKVMFTQNALWIFFYLENVFLVGTDIATKLHKLLTNTFSSNQKITFITEIATIYASFIIHRTIQTTGIAR